MGRKKRREVEGKKEEEKKKDKSHEVVLVLPVTNSLLFITAPYWVERRGGTLVGEG